MARYFGTAMFTTFRNCAAYIERWRIPGQPESFFHELSGLTLWRIRLDDNAYFKQLHI